MRAVLRRIKAALINAGFWFVVWFALGLAIDFVIRLLAGDLLSRGGLHLRPTMMLALSTATIGAVVGGVFSVYIALNFRRRRVEELSPWRFALGGALVTAAVLLGADLLTNTGVLIDRALAEPLALYRDLAIGMLYAAVVGGGTALGTIRIAQRGAKPLEGGQEPLLLDR